jgi:amidase
MAPALPPTTAGVIAPDGFDRWRDAFRMIQAREIRTIYGEFIDTRRPRLGPGIAERMAFTASVTESDVEAARSVKAAASALIRSIAPPGTILALPTAPCIAPPIDAKAEALESFRVRVMRLTAIAGMSGLPQVTLPVGTVEGCPVGLSFIGWENADEALLDLAVRLARYCGAAG